MRISSVIRISSWKAIAALVAGAAALRAAPAAIERHFGEAVVQEIPPQHVGRRVIGLLAVLADPGGQSLGQHADDGRRDHVGGDADFHEAHDRLGGGVGVKGGEDQVAGEGRLRGDPGGFQVADLADEDDVGVLAQQGAQDGGRTGGRSAG